MKEHFVKIRRLTVFSSIAAPLLLFIAFLCAAQGWMGWAAIPAVFALLLISAFPCKRISVNDSEYPGGELAKWISLFGLVMFISWI